MVYSFFNGLLYFVVADCHHRHVIEPYFNSVYGKKHDGNIT